MQACWVEENSLEKILKNIFQMHYKKFWALHLIDVSWFGAITFVKTYYCYYYSKSVIMIKDHDV